MRRDLALISLLALSVGALMALVLRQPGYTDAYYYFNAGQRLATGRGLTDAAVWTYLGLPPTGTLPVPSHLYWMPLASIAQGLSMAALGPVFHAAQVPLIVGDVGLVLIGYGVGVRLGGTRRVGWLAALLTLFSGFYMPYWAMSDTFSLFGLIGAVCLACLGLGRATGRIRWYLAAGALAGLAHLTRADGLLFALVLIGVALWPPRPRIRAALGGAGAYLLVMLPWFARNMAAVGAPLPTGGFQVAFMRGYEELVNYPPGATLADFVRWGPGNIFAARWEALFTSNGTFWTFVAVEGMLILAPFLLLGLWQRRHDPFLSGLILYALGLHGLMTLVFPLAGVRGGLLHSAAALVPFWAALGVIGLDRAVGWAARKRRWPARQARAFFSGALVIFAVALSLLLFSGAAARFNTAGAAYAQIGQTLPPDAIVMVNDPPAFYYHTGRSGVVLPNGGPEVVEALAARFGVTHVIVDVNRTAPLDGLYAGVNLPPFLTLADRQTLPDGTSIVIYRVVRP
jgi:hypothetical protein